MTTDPQVVVALGLDLDAAEVLVRRPAAALADPDWTAAGSLHPLALGAQP